MRTLVVSGAVLCIGDIPHHMTEIIRLGSAPLAEVNIRGVRDLVCISKIYDHQMTNVMRGGTIPHTEV